MKNQNHNGKRVLKTLLNQAHTLEQGRELLENPSGKKFVFIQNTPDGRWHNISTGQEVNPDTYQPERGTHTIWEQSEFEDPNDPATGQSDIL